VAYKQKQQKKTESIMNQNNQLEALISLVSTAYPDADFSFLNETVFVTPLTPKNQQNYLRLLKLARELQAENAIFERLYQQLVHLYVLNGSRLELLKNIDRRIRGVVTGQSSLLLISGISGSGKTSLVMAFQDRIQQLGAAFIFVSGFEHESTSYALWSNVARSVAAASGRPASLLPEPIGNSAQARSTHHLASSLANWLETCASPRPLVILLDDLHWADVDSLEVLNVITSQGFAAPILFIATYRSEENYMRHPMLSYLPILQRNRPYSHLHLESLTVEDIERLVNAFHGACSPQLANYLYQRAEGHPLFTVELLNDMIDQQLLAQDAEGRWLPPEQSVPVPTILKQLILQRVNRLSSQVEKLLFFGAVAGESWRLSMIEPLLEMTENEMLTALDSALRAEVIHVKDDQEETYHFAHGLIREVIYTAQPSRQRKHIHSQLAAQVEQQSDQVYTTAYHYFAGEQWEKAITCYQMAGEKALQNFAFHSALQCYQKALTAAERAGSAFKAAHLKVYDRLGRIYRALEQREQAEIVYSQMRDLASSSGERVAEGYALCNLAMVRSQHYQLVLAKSNALNALSIAEHTNDPELLINAHACLGSVLLMQGQLEQAQGHYDQVLNNAEVVQDSTTLLDTLRLSAYRTIWLAQYAKAERYAQEALQIAQRVTDPLAVVGAYQNLSFVQIEQGQYFEAYQNLHITLESINLSGTPHHQQPRLLNLLGYLFLELGDAQTALQWDQKALDAIEGLNRQTLEMLRYSLLNQATDYLHLGQFDLVQETIAQFEAIQEAAEFMQFRYTNRYQLLLCEYDLAQQRYEQAIEQAQLARIQAHTFGMVKNIAKSHWYEGQALAGLMRLREAVEHLELAVSFADSIQHGSLRWKTRLSLASALLKTGRPAGQVIGQTRALINSLLQSLSGSPLSDVLPASPWIKQLEDLEGNHSPEKPVYPAGLTEREVEVLRLVASGATNQQVAEVLHISVRTVNTHMTNILNKTSCENRTAASAFAVQHNLVTT
jgi:DNA-binding CsgD family transcriptional regulator